MRQHKYKYTGTSTKTTVQECLSVYLVGRWVRDRVFSEIICKNLVITYTSIESLNEENRGRKIDIS